jgi:hypothetical protein
MHQLPKMTATYNAAVTPEYTDFWIRGNTAAVTSFLDSLCAAIALVRDALPDDDLRLEAGVLLAEDGGRNPAALPITERYGLAGAGLGSIQPVGIGALTRDDVSAWVRRFLVAENAVLLVQGPWPEIASLPLAHGSRHVRPTPDRIPGPLPLQMQIEEFPYVVIGLELARGRNLTMVDRVVAERLHERLRSTLGHSYSVRLDQVLLGIDVRHVSFVIDSAPGRERDVAVEALRELRRIAVDGPDQADLDHDCATMESLLEDPEFADAILSSVALRVLEGDASPGVDAREELAHARTITVEQVRDCVAAALPGLVIVLPGTEPLTDTECDGAAPTPSPPCTSAPIQGTALARRTFRSGAPRGARLVYNEDAVALVADGEWHVIRYDDVVGLGHDGPFREVVSRTCCTIPIHPDAFKGTDPLVALLDARISPDARYPLPQ